MSPNLWSRFPEARFLHDELIGTQAISAPIIIVKDQWGYQYDPPVYSDTAVLLALLIKPILFCTILSALLRTYKNYDMVYRHVYQPLFKLPDAKKMFWFVAIKSIPPDKIQFLKPVGYLLHFIALFIFVADNKKLI